MLKRLLRSGREGSVKRVLVILAILALLSPSGMPSLALPPKSESKPVNRWVYFLPALLDPAPETEVYVLMLSQQRAPPVQPTSNPTKKAICGHLVTREGDRLMLDGKPFTFVGVNVSYLLEDYFPEAEMAKVVSYLAESGVTVLRIWLYRQHDLNRAERLFDLGRKYNLRFVVTLENYYFDKGSWWFDHIHYPKEYLPHVRKVVSRFRGRPEIIMWELMNEPNCSGDTIGTCPDNMVRWAQTVSEEIKALDPCRPISIGTIRIDPHKEHFRRLHALPSIDVVSIHKAADLWLSGEIEIAHELNKPVMIGEVYNQAYNQGCRPLYDRVLEKRAEVVAADMARAWAAGVDGYLLWQYGHGGVKVGDDIQWYCGIYDYLRDDPIWKVLKAAPVSRFPFSLGR